MSGLARLRRAPCIWTFLNGLFLFSAAYCGAAEETTKFTQLREKMVREDIAARGVRDARVLQVMSEIPRHLFVPGHLREAAYRDRPLPIGEGQTISQPYVVAYMTEILLQDWPRRPLKVLEIGTGSGYQAAVLAKIVDDVWTIEIREALASQAKKRLIEMGYNNIDVKHADGYFGWSDKAPFDAIMITAAVNHIPTPLLKQLKEGGRLILPLGSTTFYQTLVRVTKRGDNFETERLIDVRFVPMTGEAEKEKTKKDKESLPP